MHQIRRMVQPAQEQYMLESTGPELVHAQLRACMCWALSTTLSLWSRGSRPFLTAEEADQSVELGRLHLKLYNALAMQALRARTLLWKLRVCVGPSSPGVQTLGPPTRAGRDKRTGRRTLASVRAPTYGPSTGLAQCRRTTRGRRRSLLEGPVAIRKNGLKPPGSNASPCQVQALPISAALERRSSAEFRLTRTFLPGVRLRKTTFPGLRLLTMALDLIHEEVATQASLHATLARRS